VNFPANSEVNLRAPDARVSSSQFAVTDENPETVTGLGAARIVLRELGRFYDVLALRCCMAVRPRLTGGLQMV
jgi:hypothetical protein